MKRKEEQSKKNYLKAENAFPWRMMAGIFQFFYQFEKKMF
jgi:hypothetical protein